MKDIILAFTSLVVAILLAEIPILVEYFNANNVNFLVQKVYIVPIFFLFVLLTIKGIYEITLYTDEYIPLKLGILALILSIIGLLVFFRILLLGVFVLIAAAYWNRGIVNSYYPRKRTS